MTRTRRSSVARHRIQRALVARARAATTTTTTAEPTGTTAAEEGASTTAAPEEGERRRVRVVDTADCPDDTVDEPIEGTVSIGTTMPLSGGAAAAAFAPVAAGPAELHRPTPTRTSSLPGYTIEITIEDDQFNSNLTTPAVEGLIDETGVNLFTGMIGTANNQAVRDLLNEECYPQLFANSGAPIWGDVENYPWTIGVLAPYNTETRDLRRGHDDAVPRRRDRGGVPREQRVRRLPTKTRSPSWRRGRRHRDRRRADDRERRLEPAGVAGDEHRVAAARHHPRRAAGRAVPGVPERGGQRQGGQPRLGAAHLHHRDVRQHAAPGHLRRGRRRDLHDRQRQGRQRPGERERSGGRRRTARR